MLNAALAGIQQNQIAVELNNLVTKTRQARADAAAHQLAAQNKTPAELLGPVGTVKLLRYAQQPTVATLSNIWTLFANNKKSQHLADLQWEVNGVKEALNELDLPFVVEGSVLEAIKSLEWSMADNDAVSTGFSVWLLPEVAAGEFSGQAV